jgi:hypothetical protein
MPWKTFLNAHWGAIAAADFFSAEALTCGGLVRYVVLFVIDTSRQAAFTSPASPAGPTANGWPRSPATSPTPRPVP